jgi:uncharacterized protein (TIGR02594 family)
MDAIIDVAEYVGNHAQQLAAAGVKTVIRYYNNTNTNNFPSKCLTAKERGELHAAGLSAAVVFEQRAGAPVPPGTGPHIEDLSGAKGARDAARALVLAAAVGQPKGSAIYFAVDHDFTAAGDLAQIQDYFTKVRAALKTDYQVGVYASGLIGKRLKAAGLVDHIWLAAAGWTGTQDALRAGNWSLFQNRHEVHSPVGGFDCDTNLVNATGAGFGQFGPAGPLETPRTLASNPSAAAALFRVTARTGLLVRRGPGKDFSSPQALPFGALVTGRGLTDGWMQVDLDGDGAADGYMFAKYLEPVSGGLPIVEAQGRRPIDVARAELALGIAEVPGAADNPRIRLYHSTTEGGAAHDEVAWCSSFVNYCVEQAGFVGTDSKGARSWHDRDWGHKVTAAQDGDIVVFSRTGGGAPAGSGHVGFFVSEDATGITVLGGNQSNSIRMQRYPKAGVLGSFTYKLLSIHRAG